MPKGRLTALCDRMLAIIFTIMVLGVFTFKNDLWV